MQNFPERRRTPIHGFTGYNPLDLAALPCWYSLAVATAGFPRTRG